MSHERDPTNQFVVDNFFVMLCGLKNNKKKNPNGQHLVVIIIYIYIYIYIFQELLENRKGTTVLTESNELRGPPIH
jgi:hypothetical protein